MNLEALITELSPDSRQGLEDFFADIKEQQVELRRNSVLTSELVPAQRVTYTLRRVEKTAGELDHLSALKWTRSTQPDGTAVWELEILRKTLPIKDSETKVV